MENIIKELIFIDEKARDITSKAEGELNDVGKIIDKWKSEISKEIEAQREKEFYEIREKKESSLKRAMVEMDLEGEKLLANMEAEFNSNSGEWEEKIISAVTGVYAEHSGGAF